MKKLTIFTPTYNRAYILPKLYESLCRQTNFNFEWLVVDDGSEDNTQELLLKWKAENKIQIKSMYQKNSGKSAAHNLGVENTDTELFVCVDSDDYLVDTAVEEILDFWNKTPEHDRQRKKKIGILAKRGNDTSSITKWNEEVTAATLYQATQQYGLHGDTMLIFLTDILKKYRFPKFENEKFVPESYLYDLLEEEGVLFFYPYVLYKCQYLEDGYTYNIHKLNAKNPHGYEAYIKNRLRLDKSLKLRLEDTIRYISIKIILKDKKMIKDAVYPIFTVLLYPLGWIRYKKIYFKYL